MKKTYKSRLRGYNVYITVGNKLTNIEFKKGYIRYSIIGCLYETEDKDIQQVLEAHPQFNSKFWTDDKEEIVNAPVVESAQSTEELKEEKKVKRYTPKK